MIRRILEQARRNSRVRTALASYEGLKARAHLVPAEITTEELAEAALAVGRALRDDVAEFDARRAALVRPN